MSPMPPRKRGPPSALRIDAPVQVPHIALATGDSSASGLSSAASESDIPPFNRPSKPRSLQNMKKLSLNLASAQSSTSSLVVPMRDPSDLPQQLPPAERPRRGSVMSDTGVAAANGRMSRKVEDGSPTVPYLDGPIQIVPGIWLGSEDNAKDWPCLLERGIKSILNVAKEVVSPFDAPGSQALRAFASTPNLAQTFSEADPTYYPPNPAIGRPAMHYLKLQWSHGQQDLVEHGLPEAMAFADAALERGDGVLIHCQCGISRSATLVIALVMRAAAERSPSVPSEIWALKGMQGAYTFVKEKSKWVSPNMSLIYQLLEYEKKLRGDSGDMSGNESGMEDEEWGRQRRLLDETDDETEFESSLVMREAQYLDKAMEDRVLARKTSASSIASSSSGVGMGAAWRSRYGSRKRAGSIASNMTNGSSILSEELVEEEEEQELLGIGGGFNDEDRASSAEPESTTSSPEDDVHSAVTPRRPVRVPPSAPVWKTSFNIPPPATAFRPTFNLPPPPTKGKRRPAPIGILPAVPSSPIKIIVDDSETPSKPAPRRALTLPPPRARTESKKPVPPPLHLRSTLLKPKNPNPPSALATPSQTLFVFPPSPTLTTRTPSAMTLTSNLNGPVPFPSLSTPRVSTFRSQGRTRSFIGVGAPPTPTTAFSKVDARGFFGLE